MNAVERRGHLVVGRTEATSTVATDKYTILRDVGAPEHGRERERELRRTSSESKSLSEHLTWPEHQPAKHLASRLELCRNSQWRANMENRVLCHAIEFRLILANVYSSNALTCCRYTTGHMTNPQRDAREML